MTEMNFGLREKQSDIVRCRACCGLKPFLNAWKPLRGWRVRHSSLCRGVAGLIQLAGLARSQTGLMVFE